MSVTLRELQLCELESLKDIKAVCEKHNIRYYLSSGTLLGAVRHQGFIPWDDDVDIEMPYTDYLRFLEIAPVELGDRYTLQNSDTDPYFHYAYSRLRKKNTTMMREWERTIPSHHGVWVDIFPMAKVGGTMDYRVKRLMLKVCTFLRMHDYVFKLNRKWLTEQGGHVQIVMVMAARLLPKAVREVLRNAMLRRVFSQKEKPYLSNVWTNITRRIPKEAFSDPAAMLRFEDAEFAAPKDYDCYLRVAYGDYMTPPPDGQRSGGHGELILDLEHEWKPEAEGCSVDLGGLE